MTDLPGYGSGVYCTDCYSTNHTINHCPLLEEEMTRDQYTGRDQALFDDLQAVLRAHGKDDDHAHTLMEVLEDD